MSVSMYYQKKERGSVETLFLCRTTPASAVLSSHPLVGAPAGAAPRVSVRAPHAYPFLKIK